MVDASVINAI